MALKEENELMTRVFKNFTLSEEQKRIFLSAHRPQHTLCEMQEIAGNLGGKCHSVKYVNATTDLLWQCDKGHLWEAPFARIRDNHWCPVCQSTTKSHPYHKRPRGVGLVFWKVLEVLVRPGELFFEWLNRINDLRITILKFPILDEQYARELYEQSGRFDNSYDDFIEKMIKYRDPRIVNTVYFEKRMQEKEK